MEAKVRRDRKLELLGSVITDYEAEFGEITTDEMNALAATDQTLGVLGQRSA